MPEGFRRAPVDYIERISTVPLLIIGDLGMRKLPANAAEALLEIIMRRYERVSTLLTLPNRWPAAALDRAARHRPR